MAAAHALAPADYRDAVLFLATAGVVVPLFKRLRVSPILGFLAAGVALGPYGLGALAELWRPLRAVTVSRPEDVAQLAEFGVVFLLFTIGLELSWERLRAMRRLVFGLGGLQLLVSGLAIAAVLIAGLHTRPLVATILAAALALSTTALALPSLAEARRLQAPAGRAVFSVLLLQDLSVAPLLVALSVIGSGARGLSGDVLIQLAPRVLGLIAIVVAGRLVLRPMMRSVAKARSEELFMAASLLIVIGAGLLAAASSLSMALGAFVAGLLLAETEYRHEIEVVVEPFKGLLLGLFFVSVGIGLDLGQVVQRPATVFALLATLLLMKTAVVFALVRLFRMSSRAALESALALAAGGELAFVLIAQGFGTHLIPRALGQSAIAAVTLSMFMVPGLIAIGARIGRGGVAVEKADPPPEDQPGAPRVIVVGYGRVGRMVTEMLSVHERPWVVIEREARGVQAARRSGANVYYGDAARPELLKRCGLEAARALVVTMDSPDGVEAVVQTARELRPDLTIVARARDQRHAARLYELGVSDAVPETVEASLQLSESVLVDIGVPMGLVIASIHEKRDEYRRALNRPDALGARVRAARSRV